MHMLWGWLVKVTLIIVYKGKHCSTCFVAVDFGS